MDGWVRWGVIAQVRKNLGREKLNSGSLPVRRGESSAPRIKPIMASKLQVHGNYLSSFFAGAHTHNNREQERMESHESHRPHLFSSSHSLSERKVCQSLSMGGMSLSSSVPVLQRRREGLEAWCTMGRLSNVALDVKGPSLCVCLCVYPSIPIMLSSSL